MQNKEEGEGDFKGISQETSFLTEQEGEEQEAMEQKITLMAIAGSK